MTSNVNYDIEFVKGVKTALFGGEGLFFATLRGPGTVWIQSLPFSRLQAESLQLHHPAEDQRMKVVWQEDYLICLMGIK